MTDKQIIIDGVDVSGCDELINECDCYLTQEHDYRSETPYTYNKCSGFPNCYYKQLKRKEQECEELNKELHKNFEEKDKLHLIIDRLLEASGYDTNTASPEDFEDVYENMRYEKQQLDQLKQAIEKIKEIAEENEELLQGYHKEWANNKLILQICDEVNDER